MKYTKLLFAIAAVFIFATTNTVNAQNTVKPVAMDVLEARKDLLKETTKLNKLKIKLSDLQAKVKEQEKNLEKANDRSAKTAVESKVFSVKASANTGDGKLTNRASSAAKKSYNDARKAQKLTNTLNANNRKIKSYETDIEKLRTKIEKMDQQLKFSENTNN
jgi:chromosome segregation ATPase